MFIVALDHLQLELHILQPPDLPDIARPFILQRQHLVVLPVPPIRTAHSNLQAPHMDARGGAEFGKVAFEPPQLRKDLDKPHRLALLGKEGGKVLLGGGGAGDSWRAAIAPEHVRIHEPREEARLGVDALARSQERCANGVRIAEARAVIVCMARVRLLEVIRTTEGEAKDVVPDLWRNGREERRGDLWVSDLHISMQVVVRQAVFMLVNNAV